MADPPVTPGNDRVLQSGLPGCPYCFLESGELPFADGNPAYGLQLQSSLSGVSGSSGVGPTTGLFTIVLGGRIGRRTGDGGGR